MVHCPSKFLSIWVKGIRAPTAGPLSSRERVLATILLLAESRERASHARFLFLFLLLDGPFRGPDAQFNSPHSLRNYNQRNGVPRACLVSSSLFFSFSLFLFFFSPLLPSDRIIALIADLWLPHTSEAEWKLNAADLFAPWFFRCSYLQLCFILREFFENFGIMQDRNIYGQM